MFKNLCFMAFASALLSGCYSGKSIDAVKPPSLKATLQKWDGTKLVPIGMASMQFGAAETVLKLELDNGSIGSFGMHIHAVGKCDGPDFTTAGPHWNPDAKQHGHDNPAGAHKGDMPNIAIVKPGAFAMTKTLPAMMMQDINDADGSAIIIHEKADDYRTDPSGNSGKRVICGVFGAR